MVSQAEGVPRWVSAGLVPLVNLVAALLISGLIVELANPGDSFGASAIQAMRLLVVGAFGYEDAVGFTLFYATTFVFTGLAVAIAFHCGLFNIGGDGQAYIGGLGVGLVCLALDSLPFVVVFPLALVASVVFGAAWAFLPAWLQARRGSHIVITTIMFNFIAAALMTYLLVNVLIAPGQQSPETRAFAEQVWLPQLHEVAGWFGMAMAKSPANLSILLALIAAAGFYVLVWRTRWGYEIRTVGLNERAAIYGGISPARNIILAMCISGGLAGLVGLNAIMGSEHRLILNFTSGFGFVGIAVALMGRNHPLGVCLAALLFGALYQGGTEINFEMPKISREMVAVVQGMVILFVGALEHLFRAPVEHLFRRRLTAVAEH